MTPRNRYTFYIDDEQRAALTAIKERDGISESEQIRRAINAWVEQKGVKVGAARTLATPRKRGQSANHAIAGAVRKHRKRKGGV